MILKKLNKNIINIILILFLILSLNYIKNISYFKYENLNNLFNKNWLPADSIHSSDVTQIIKILRKHNILNFKFSNNFINSVVKYRINSVSDKNYIYYRTITYAYPIIFDKNSMYTVFIKNLEDVTLKCKIIDETEKIILTKC